MKKRHMLLLVNLLAGGIISTLAQEPTTAAAADTAAQEARPVMTGAYEMPEPVPAARIPAVLDRITSAGVAIDPARVLFVGIEKGTGNVVVLYLDRQGEPVKQVVPIGGDKYRELVGEVPAPPAAGKPEGGRLNQDGRIYFIVSTALRTLTVYPMGFGLLLDNGDDNTGRTIAGLSLLTFGGSLYGSYRFTRNRELGYGRVAMMNYGGELAYTYSALASRLVYGMNIFKSRNEYEDILDPYGNVTGQDTLVAEPDEIGKVLAVCSMVGFPLGIYLGSRIKVVGNCQYGNADIIRFFGRSAWLYGWLVPMYGSGGSRYDYNLASAGLTMALVPAGLYTGYRLVRGHDYSSGRGFMIEAAGVMGGLTGLLTPMLFDVDDFTDDTERRVLITSIMAGHALGTTLGFKYKSGESYTFFQGVFTGLSGVCGAAVGLSAPFLAQAKDDKAYIAAGLVGGWGGFLAGEYLAKSLFEVASQDKRQSGLDISFPVAYQWPLLMSGYLGAKNSDGKPVAAELVSIRF